MRREDLMKSDLLSEIVLLGSALVLFVILALVITAAVTGTPSLP
jgi:hypothetical protein